MNITRGSVLGMVGLNDLGQSFASFIAGNIDQAKQAVASGKYQRVRPGYGIPGCDQAGCGFDPANTKALYLLGNCTDCSAPAPWAPTGNGGYAWTGSGNPPYPGAAAAPSSSTMFNNTFVPNIERGGPVGLQINPDDIGGPNGPLGGGSMLSPASLRAAVPTRKSSILPYVIGLGILGALAAVVVLKKRKHAVAV